MNGPDDLPASVRDALARSDEPDERALRLDQLCAQAEATGDPAVAAWAAVESAGHLDQALARLAHVLLLFARHVEADCYDALGDACAALGDTGGAASAWQEAVVRYERVEKMRPARTVRDKLAALHA